MQRRRKRDGGKPRKVWDVFTPPIPEPKPRRIKGAGVNGVTNTPPARPLPALQPIILRAKERRAVKQWDVARGPVETLELFYVDGSKDVGNCFIREAPDSRHPLVYVTQHPAEVHGAPLAWCVECESRDCTGCVWALKAYRAKRRELMKSDSDLDTSFRALRGELEDDDLPF